jgi:MFS family permease
MRPEMRRLVLLVSLLVLVDTLLYAALTPLLPRFEKDLSLSKALAGVLVAAYPAGALVGGIPGGIAAARLGPRRAVLGGLALFIVASVGFALANSFPLLLLARFVQGCSSALTWAGAFSWLLAAAPRERRGQLVGTAMGAAIFGALLGPVLGAAAALAGRAPAFLAIAVLGVVLGAAALRLPDARAEEPTFAALRRAARSHRFLGGLALMSVPSLLFGVLAVLAPLHLSAAGWGAVAIGVVWIVAASLETVQAPVIGRLIDARGRARPVRYALVAGALLSFGLASGARPLVYVPMVVLANMAYGILFTPGMALIADGADDSGLAQGLAFGIMNAAWAIGAVVGPAGGGAIASATGDAVPYVLCGVLCIAAFVVTRSQHERAAVLVDRLPGDAAGVGRQ